MTGLIWYYTDKISNGSLSENILRMFLFFHVFFFFFFFVNENETETKRKRYLNGFFETHVLTFSQCNGRNVFSKRFKV